MVGKPFRRYGIVGRPSRRSGWPIRRSKSDREARQKVQDWSASSPGGLGVVGSHPGGPSFPSRGTGVFGRPT